MKNNKLKIIAIILLIVVICIISFTIVTYNNNMAIKRENIKKIGLKIIIDKKEHIVTLANNDTVLELQKQLPITKYFTKYEDSLYYAKLDNRINADGEIVSEVKPKGIYYHIGWHSIVIAYKNYTFKNQRLVYLGSIEDNIKNKNSIQEITLDTNKKN